MDKIITAIQTKRYEPIREYFTDNGWDTFKRTIEYGNAKIITDDIAIHFAALRNMIIARSIPMKFSFENNREEFNENVVFTFCDEKVDAVSFSLSKTAVDSIICKSDRFALMDEKMQILQFMENYKTAYCLERIDFINSIFSENALIIVGQVIQEDPEYDVEGMLNKLDNDKVRYFRKTKTEYIDHLRTVFASNEVINIHFEENDVQRVAQLDEKVFGIQIAQYYYSTNYADKGYLFLMFDLNDINKPKILVRSWQPQKNADGSIIGLTDFEF